MSWAYPPHAQQVGTAGHALAVPQTIFLTASLTGAANRHGGAFKFQHHAKNITARIRSWLDTSPALCFCLADRTCSLQVFHDGVQTPAMEADVAALRSGGVTIHAVAPDPTVLGNDRRYLLFERLLRRDDSYGCAFLLDMDVHVLVLPPCRWLTRARKLVVGSDDLKPDSVRGVRAWLRSKATALQYNYTDRMRNFLAPNGDDFRNAHRHLCFTCAIVGGPKSVLLPALHDVVQAYKATWAANVTKQMMVGLDMLLWNNAALAHQESRRLVSGYPLGPVNLPQNWHPWAHGVRGLDRPGSLAWIRKTYGLYWFSHKPAGTGWVALFRNVTAACTRGAQQDDLQREAREAAAQCAWPRSMSIPFSTV